MSLPYLFRSLVSLLLVVGVTAPVLAGEPTEQIKQTTDKILSIVKDPALKGPSKVQERRRSRLFRGKSPI